MQLSQDATELLVDHLVVIPLLNDGFNDGLLSVLTVLPLLVYLVHDDFLELTANSNVKEYVLRCFFWKVFGFLPWLLHLTDLHDSRRVDAGRQHLFIARKQLAI